MTPASFDVAYRGRIECLAFADSTHSNRQNDRRQSFPTIHSLEDPSW